jgi:hypothetical protein
VAQGKLGISAAMNPQPIRNPVVQRIEDDDLEAPEAEERFWIPRKYHRPKAPTLGDWLTPALAPYQRRERQIARSRAGMVRAQERLDQRAKRYNFHDLTAARPASIGSPGLGSSRRGRAAGCCRAGCGRSGASCRRCRGCRSTHADARSAFHSHVQP